METTRQMSLEEYLALEYPFNVIADPDGGYVIEYPDLPGCITQAETLDEIIGMAEDARTGWIEVAFDRGIEIPLASYPAEYSGKFNLRLPRSLHRKLAEAAERDGVSLNSYVAEVLSRGDAQIHIERRMHEMVARLEQRLAEIEGNLEEIRESMRYRPAHVPAPSPKRDRFQLVQNSVAA